MRFMTVAAGPARLSRLSTWVRSSGRVIFGSQGRLDKFVNGIRGKTRVGMRRVQAWSARRLCQIVSPESQACVSVLRIVIVAAAKAIPDRRCIENPPVPEAGISEIG
jgi:hypothetical protein